MWTRYSDLKFNYIYLPPFQDARYKTDDMLYNIVNPVIEDFKNGNSYAIGG